MVTATVDDPHGMICWLAVAHESPGLVVIHGDMSTRGKRADVYRGDGGRFDFVSDPDRGKFAASVTFGGLPEDSIEVTASVSRYSLFIVLVSRKSLGAARDVYVRPAETVEDEA